MVLEHRMQLVQIKPLNAEFGEVSIASSSGFHI